MARELDDLGFWLPSEFLTDDDLLTDFKADRLKTARVHDFSNGFGKSLGFNSNLSSPGELVTETESEDDDLAYELTRRLAQSALLCDYASKGWKLSGSPQSTLCGCKLGSTVSPNSVSGFCSPPDAEDYPPQDFLHAAAEEVARMRMIEETAAFYSSKHFPSQAKPRTGAWPQQCPNPASGFYPNKVRSPPHLSSQLLQAAKMKQQMMKNGYYMTGLAEFKLWNERGNGGDGRAQGTCIAARPGLQQPGSGMRVVYHGEPGPKKERTGTGVFLPQRFGSLPAENRKKSVCPTVLLPEKVVHALNVNVDAVDAQLHRGGIDHGSSSFDFDAALKHRKNLMMAQQRRNLAPQPAMNEQLRLPRDWTY